jgi:acetyl esterase/lipase
MVDDRQVTASSAFRAPVWTPEANRLGWEAYLGSTYGTDDVAAYAAAARASDLGGLPPAFVCVGGADGFRDEGIDYAARMMLAGVEVELHVYPGAPHGFLGLFSSTAVAMRAQRDVDGWLARQLRS